MNKRVEVFPLTLLVNMLAPISIWLTTRPRICERTANATVRGWPTGSNVRPTSRGFKRLHLFALSCTFISETIPLHALNVYCLIIRCVSSYAKGCTRPFGVVVFAEKFLQLLRFRRCFGRDLFSIVSKQSRNTQSNLLMYQSDCLRFLLFAEWSHISKDCGNSRLKRRSSCLREK